MPAQRTIKTDSKQVVKLQKQPKDTLQWGLSVNKAIADLSNALIDPVFSIEEIANTILEHAKSLTNSLHGYIASIDPISKDLIAHTLTNMMGNECKVTGKNKKIVFPVGPDGRYPSLWGHPLNIGKSLYTNSPSSHSASGGTPKGHIKLKNFLSVPATAGKELIVH